MRWCTESQGLILPCCAAIDDILKYCFFLYKDVDWSKAAMWKTAKECDSGDKYVTKSLLHRSYGQHYTCQEFLLAALTGCERKILWKVSVPQLSLSSDQKPHCTNVAGSQRNFCSHFAPWSFQECHFLVFVKILMKGELIQCIMFFSYKSC